MWSSHHCRFWCADNTVGSWHQPTVSVKPTLPVCGSSRQWCSSQHCRLVAQADSDSQANTIGLWLESTVRLKPTLPARGSRRQWFSSQHYRFVARAGSGAQANTVSFSFEPAVLQKTSLPVWHANRQWSLFRILLFYIIYFFDGIGFRFIFAT